VIFIFIFIFIVLFVMVKQQPLAKDDGMSATVLEGRLPSHHAW
jgi:hypothetical protein